MKKIGMILGVCLGIVLIALLLSVEVSGDTVVVPDDTPNINTAVLTSNPGDTIYIKNGTYAQYNVVVNKPLNIVGESRDGVIIDGGSVALHCFKITSDYVNFSSLTITDAGATNEKSGLYFDIVSHCTVDNCNIIDNNYHGITFNKCSNGFNTVSNSNISGNGYDGVYMTQSDNITLYNCKITDDGNYGTYISQCLDITLTNCTYFNTDENSVISQLNRFDMSGCYLNNSGQNINAYQLYNATVTDNWFDYSYKHVYQDHCSNNFYYNNTFENAILIGVHFSVNGNNNTVCHNNFINNTKHAQDDSVYGSNRWNCTLGGNYWSGFVSNDTDGDGFLDDPYPIPDSSPYQDENPLAYPTWYVPPVPPPTAMEIFVETMFGFFFLLILLVVIRVMLRHVRYGFKESGGK